MFQHRKFSSTSTRPVSHTCKLGCGWRRQGPQALPPGNLEGTGPARVGQLSLPPCLSPLGKKAQQQVHGATCMGSCLLSHPLPPLSKPSAWPLLRKLECLLCRKSQDRGRDVPEAETSRCQGACVILWVAGWAEMGPRVEPTGLALPVCPGPWQGGVCVGTVRGCG